MTYTATTTVDQVRAERISRNFGYITGTCNVTDYASGTLAEITDITKYFKTVKIVLADISDKGIIFRWSTTSKAFKCYDLFDAFTSGQTASGSAVVINAAGKVLCANAGGGADMGVTAITDDVGQVRFIAFGLI